MNMLRINDAVDPFASAHFNRLGSQPTMPPSPGELRELVSGFNLPEDARRRILAVIDQCEPGEFWSSWEMECRTNVEILVTSVRRLLENPGLGLAGYMLRPVVEVLDVSSNVKQGILEEIAECDRLQEEFDTVFSPPLPIPGEGPIEPNLPEGITVEAFQEAIKAVNACVKGVSARVLRLLQDAREGGHPRSDDGGMVPPAAPVEPAVATGTLVAAGSVAALLVALAV